MKLNSLNTSFFFFRNSDNKRLHSLMENATGDKRRELLLPPIKGDGSVDYDGESIFLLWYMLY